EHFRCLALNGGEALLGGLLGGISADLNHPTRFVLRLRSRRSRRRPCCRHGRGLRGGRGGGEPPRRWAGRCPRRGGHRRARALPPSPTWAAALRALPSSQLPAQASPRPLAQGRAAQVLPQPRERAAVVMARASPRPRGRAEGRQAQVLPRRRERLVVAMARASPRPREPAVVPPPQASQLPPVWAPAPPPPPAHAHP